MTFWPSDIFSFASPWVSALPTEFYPDVVLADGWLLVAYLHHWIRWGFSRELDCFTFGDWVTIIVGRCNIFQLATVITFLTADTPSLRSLSVITVFPFSYHLSEHYLSLQYHLTDKCSSRPVSPHLVLSVPSYITSMVTFRPFLCHLFVFASVYNFVEMCGILCIPLISVAYVISFASPSFVDYVLLSLRQPSSLMPSQPLFCGCTCASHVQVTSTNFVSHQFFTRPVLCNLNVSLIPRSELIHLVYYSLRWFCFVYKKRISSFISSRVHGGTCLK